MSDTARKIFPVESVLALVMGKEDVDVKELAGYLAGCSIECDACAHIIGPVAGGWLSACYPQFMDLDFSAERPWEAFVSEAAQKLGDNVSLPQMPERQRQLVAGLRAKLAELVATKKAQAGQIAEMQAQIDSLNATAAKAAELGKKVDQQEDTIKTMKSEMSGLRKQLVLFNGKIPMAQDELMQTIKDAIKDNMKGFAVAGAAGAAAGAAAEGAASPDAAEADNGPAEDFGFGNSGPSSDGFGF